MRISESSSFVEGQISPKSSNETPTISSSTVHTAIKREDDLGSCKPLAGRVLPLSSSTSSEDLFTSTLTRIENALREQFGMEPMSSNQFKEKTD